MRTVPFELHGYSDEQVSSFLSMYRTLGYQIEFTDEFSGILKIDEITFNGRQQNYADLGLEQFGYEPSELIHLREWNCALDAFGMPISAFADREITEELALAKFEKQQEEINERTKTK